MEAYIYNTNAILAFLLIFHTKVDFLATFENLYKYLTKRCYKPNFHKFDNEASKLTKNFIHEQKQHIK